MTNTHEISDQHGYTERFTVKSETAVEVEGFYHKTSLGWPRTMTREDARKRYRALVQEHGYSKRDTPLRTN